MLFLIIFTINIGIGTYFVYSHWYLKKYDARVMLDTHTEQQFIEHINEMGQVKEINVKNQTLFF